MKRISLLIAVVLVLAGCATQNSGSGPLKKGTRKTVRTTAYTHSEPGGSRNAIGSRLSSGPVKSAASDWSRFPLGTKFRVVQTGDVYRIEDYGAALVGTETIDLYKPSRRSMRQWGTRRVDIEILEWGSYDKSLKTLKPRHRSRYVRRMIESLNKKAN